MPRFQRERLRELAPGTVALLGVPWDEGSTFMRGPAGAPAAIRAQLHSGSANLCTEAGLDLGRQAAFVDLGDLDPGQGEAARLEIERCVSGLLEHGARVLSIGGDHAVTAPLLAAHAKTYPDIEILHFDAHPDLYDEYDGNRYANACPFARIMEAGHARRLVQVGIRTMNPQQRAQAERFGVEVLEMRDFDPAVPLRFDGPVYLSFDIDVLDPAFAPGVSHVEPGGMSTRDALRVIQCFEGRLFGADIVEINPERDPSGLTAMVGAKVLKELAGRLLER
jgi:agmatinase